MHYIKNREELLSHGNTALREHAIEIVDHALSEANPYQKTVELVRVRDGVLHVGARRFDLSVHKRIYVMGAGKATFPIAKALDDILGDHITDGVVICKYGQEGTLAHSRLYFGSHPVPDEAGHLGAREIMKLCRQTRENDIVFSISTGGSTSLMPYPVDGVSLEDKRLTGQVLLRSGATMLEMNFVRKHLTQLKSGFMAKIIHPLAPIINLGVLDGVGFGDEFCVEPTTPDATTFDDARTVLGKYNLWEKIPKSAADYIRSATPDMDTPADLSDRIVYNHTLVQVDSATESAHRKAVELGYNAIILSTFVEGESRELGGFLSAVAREVKHYNRPVTKPAAIICGGESSQKILIANPGEGGPSQQTALGAAVWLNGEDGIVVCAVDTDGTDGPTDLAGGMVDSSTPARATELNLNLFAYMDAFNDSVALRALNDAVYTGATGTNVNDLRVVLIK